jgi:hypothetical protein
MTLACFGYTFQLEREGDGRSGVEGRRNVDRTADCKEVIDEDLTITCGEQTARIVNGKLTAGVKDRRAVKLGDTVKHTSAGKLSVNNEER